ncbi:MAG: flagellar brake protein [Cellvibrionaceae bacterium]
MIGLHSTPAFIQNIFKVNKLPANDGFISHLASHITLRDLEKYKSVLELQGNRQLIQIEISLNGHRRSYQSMIVGIDFEQRHLILDTFSPSLNPKFLEPNQSVTFRHSANNQILEFSSQLLSVTEDEEPLFIIDLPEDITYRQRRFYPRLDMSDSHHFSIKLKSPRHIPWFSKLKNISAGGASVSVGGDITNELTKNCQLKHCEVILPFGAKIPCSVTVKNFRYVKRPYEHTLLNVSFHEMQFQNRLELQHQISLSQKLLTDALNVNNEMSNVQKEKGYHIN